MPFSDSETCWANEMVDLNVSVKIKSITTFFINFMKGNFNVYLLCRICNTLNQIHGLISLINMLTPGPGSNPIINHKAKYIIQKIKKTDE